MGFSYIFLKFNEKKKARDKPQNKFSRNKDAWTPLHINHTYLKCPLTISSSLF